MRSLFLFLLIISLTLFISYSQKGILDRKSNLELYKVADKLFHDAEAISDNPNYDELKEEDLNRQSLAIFQKINLKLIKGREDSLAFYCHLKTALLYHFFDSLERAKNEYQQSIQLKKSIPAISDSLLFQPYLFIGRIFYSQNQFDSSYKYYKLAEKISEEQTNTLNEEQRLYNGLGSMFYETGNYKQAKNYYEKAVSLLNKKDDPNSDFLIRYKSNIGSSLLKLERYKEADSIYNSLLTYNINVNEILQNLGSIQLQTGMPEKALFYFRKVTYDNSLNILLYNKMAKAFLMLNKLDSVEKYVQLAINENEKWNGSKKNILHGLTLQESAEKYIIEKQYIKGIENYQKAIVQFYPDYVDTDIFHNPAVFKGVFSYINLFNTLTAKADAFEKLYAQDKKQPTLDAALQTYQSAFQLADYVEKTYESDEARLFLNKIKYKVHDKPIHISLQLYELTNNIKYLESAYYFDQQNKASILSLSLQETALKTQRGPNANLFDQETSIKTSITRLSLKANQNIDSTQLENIKTAIRDYEIQLGKVEDKINELPSFKAKKFATSIPPIIELQKLLSKNTALLSYHLAEKELVILCITAKEFNYTKLPIDTTFFNALKLFKQFLNNYTGEQQYDGKRMSNQLYNTIIKPIFDKIKDKDQLLIIPDDELNNLPFEALGDENGHFLLDKFSVQYQYSTALLTNDFGKIHKNNTLLAMAPFASRGNEEFAKLVFTKNEIENLKGKILFDSAATKNNFLANAGKSTIIHLATHTIVNDTVPEKSLIAFYPFTNLPTSENNLYVQEIYNLKLESTKLVVLSACETGTGQLAKGEGLMSLARAFTYAGCPNIIASLWKADDKSTAWIMQRFYHYYNNESDAVTSLQQAKLDYLNSPEIEKRFKTPNYWAHLVITGIPEKNQRSFTWAWALGIIICTTTFFFLLIKKRKTI